MVQYFKGKVFVQLQIIKKRSRNCTKIFIKYIFKVKLKTKLKKKNQKFKV